MNLTVQMYHQIVSAVKEFNWRAIIKDNIIISEFFIMYFDDKNNHIYVSPNMGDNCDKEIELLQRILSTVKDYVMVKSLGYHIYYNGEIIWNTHKDFIKIFKNMLADKFQKPVFKLVMERKYGAPIELSKMDGSPIKPIFG